MKSREVITINCAGDLESFICTLQTSGCIVLLLLYFFEMKYLFHHLPLSWSEIDKSAENTMV